MGGSGMTRTRAREGEDKTAERLNGWLWMAVGVGDIEKVWYISRGDEEPRRDVLYEDDDGVYSLFA